jgi:hypothetical protein
MACSCSSWPFPFLARWETPSRWVRLLSWPSTQRWLATLPVVLTDLPVALLATTAILFAVQAFRSGRWFDVSLAALGLVLTLGAKHSGLIALVTVGTSGAAVALLPRITARTMSRASVLILTFTILLGALVVLWWLYGFRFSETASGEEAFNRSLALKMEDVRGFVARRTLHALASAHLLPRSYIWGLADTIRTGIEGTWNTSQLSWSYVPRSWTRLLLPHRADGQAACWAPGTRAVRSHLVTDAQLSSFLAAAVCRPRLDGRIVPCCACAWSVLRGRAARASCASC